MGKAVAYDPKKVDEVEAPFARLPRSLLSSDAWRKMPINTRRLIDFLLIEHLNHAGMENGRLYCTYDQLQAWGIGRRHIHPAITDAEHRGLIEVLRGGRKGFAQTHLSRFRLTFFKTSAKDQHGNVYWVAPTNEWKRYCEQGRENQKDGSEGELLQCTKVNSYSARRETVEAAKPAETLAPATVHEGAPLIYSGPMHGPSEPASARQPEDQPARPAPGTTCPSAPPVTSTSDQPRSACTAGGSAQIDLEELTGRANQPHPDELLRAATVAWCDREGKGAHKRLAGMIGLSTYHLSNFKSGRFALNATAKAMLREVVLGQRAA